MYADMDWQALADELEVSPKGDEIETVETVEPVDLPADEPIETPLDEVPDSPADETSEPPADEAGE
jgi:hypothetical protein